MARLNFVIIIVSVVLLAPLVTGAATPPAETPVNIIFVESSDATGTVPQQKLTSCVLLLARHMSVAGKDLPPIVVVHVSEKAGAAVGVKRSLVRRSTGKTVPETYYELWLAGRPNMVDYTVSLEAILENHFGLRLTTAERKELVTRAVRQLNATVSAFGE